MTNYTYEEKQIAIKMLEDLMAHEVECTRNLYYPFNFHLHAVPSNLIREKIKQLKTVTFGDIKHQVGVKFKTGEFNDEKYAIGFDKEYQCYQLINLMTFSINDLSLIEDTDLIEVINETTSI